MVFLRLADLTRHGTDILFPHRCAACGKKLFGISERKICENCSGDITFLQHPVCRICGMELVGDKVRENLCGECLGNSPPFLLARSVVRYSTPVQKLLYGLKYGKDTSVLPGIAEIISHFDMALFDQCDYVLPVPLHPRRLRQRGLNQSVLLAKIFFQKRAQTILNANSLLRTRNTVPQTTLDGGMRRKNLKGVFAMVNKAGIGGKIVCLVDDVFTTGTTVTECSRVLLYHGAREVRVLTLTRVKMAQCSS